MKSLIAIVSLLGMAQAYAHGTGLSSYPLELGQNLFSTEFSGITSDGGGVGLQGRFTRKINPKMVFDGGFGISGGERNSRLFVGTDYELFPDYMKQPKVSIRTSFEHAREFDSEKNILAVAPKISKGFSLWGHEAFPYVAMPIGLNLDSETRQYESQASLNFGITGNLPFEGYRNILGVLETTVGIKDAYTGLFAGVSFPLN